MERWRSEKKGKKDEEKQADKERKRNSIEA